MNMKWKYNMIFLFMLFSLFSSEKLAAQYCLDFKYDKSGNRTEVYAHNCGFEFKEQIREMVDEEISEKNLSDILVYPNPTNGCFVVNIGDETDAVLYQIYNAQGHLLQKGECLMNQKIDITNNPAGVYLLRIIKRECVYGCVVVKL